MTNIFRLKWSLQPLLVHICVPACMCLCVYILIFLMLLFSHCVLSGSLWPLELQLPLASLSFTISGLLKLMSIESVMPPNHLFLCSLLPLPLVFPRIRVFSNELALHIWWPKYWSFSFITSASSEYSALISFRIDWFDLLAVQGSLKILHHHNLKASILSNSAFFMIQFSHLYMTTEKNIVLTIRTFVDKVMSAF